MYKNKHFSTASANPRHVYRILGKHYFFCFCLKKNKLFVEGILTSKYFLVQIPDFAAVLELILASRTEEIGRSCYDPTLIVKNRSVFIWQHACLFASLQTAEWEKTRFSEYILSLSTYSICYISKTQVWDKSWHSHPPMFARVLGMSSLISNSCVCVCVCNLQPRGFICFWQLYRMHTSRILNEIMTY